MSGATSPAAVERIADLFDLVSSTYDQVGVDFFSPIAAGLVESLQLVPGQSLLDVGCGTGAVLTLAAPQVGHGAQVLGVDLSQGMLDQARRQLDLLGLDWVGLAPGNGQELELPSASFDVVSASLVLFFIPNPLAALKSWFSVLTPGGRVGVSSFGSRDPAWIEIDELFTPFLPADLLDARTSGTRGPFASDSGVEELFAAAGFSDIRTTHTEVDVVFADIDHWHSWTMSTGQRAMWRAVPEADQPSVMAEAARVLRRCLGADGQIHLGQQVRNTVGTRPVAVPATKEWEGPR